MLNVQEGIQVLASHDKYLNLDIVRVDNTKVFFDVDFKQKLSDLIENDDFLLIIDHAVYRAHKYRFTGLKVVVIEAGDKYKNQRNIDKIIDAGIANKISRTGYFVGIGGGTVTDMVGFAANNYFRGIRYINVPTSLLGMVDAAIGGKTAINHEYQKNMIGSFYHPSFIIYDFSFLKTLDLRNYRNGFGEIIKVALLSHDNLFDLLQKAPSTVEEAVSADLKTMIRMTAENKFVMLGANCFERDLERPLNLGHTVAHPLEDITHFRVMHGEAVAFGCIFAAHISNQQGKFSDEQLTHLINVVNRFHLLDEVNQINLDPEVLWERLQRLIMQRGGAGLLYVLPTDSNAKSQIINNITRSEFDNAFLALAKNPQVTSAVLN